MLQSVLFSYRIDSRNVSKKTNQNTAVQMKRKRCKWFENITCFLMIPRGGFTALLTYANFVCFKGTATVCDRFMVSVRLLKRASRSSVQRCKTVQIKILFANWEKRFLYKIIEKNLSKEKLILCRLLAQC